MRIVVLETDGTGGMLHFSHMLADAIATRGHDVTLFTASDYELADLPRSFEARPEFSLWSRQEQSTGSETSLLRRVYVAALRRSVRAGRLFLEMWRAVTKLIAISPDLVIVRPFPLPGHNVLLWRLKRSGTSIVEVTHEFEPRDTIHPQVARIENWLSGASSPHVDARLFMGERIRARYEALYPRYPENRTYLIPHGDGELFRLLADDDYDPLSTYGLPADTRAVLFFGNLRPSKGLDDLVRAFAAAERPPNTHLLIVGHPSRDFDQRTLPQLASDLEIADRVTFDMSYVPNEHVGPLFAVARCLVLPYSTATQSGPLHIALTYRTPVIATRIGGIGDVIADEATGLLVEPGDVAGLTEAMERLLNDEDLVEGLRAGMSEQIRQHSWVVVADAVLHAAGEVMAKDVS